MRTVLTGFIFLSAMLLCPADARAADDVGATGVVYSVELLTPSSDSYIQFHGILVVQESGGAELAEYRWGGTSCGSNVLSEEDVDRLLELAATPYMNITPRHQPGQGVTDCLVGFTAQNKKFE